MKNIRPSTTARLPDSAKTGEVYVAGVIAGDEAPQVRMGCMYYAPGARTAWHSHAGGEYLHIIEGTALVQERGGGIAVLYAGETIFTGPDVEHWHGAPPDTFMVQLAIWGAPVVDDDEAETEWGPHVTDEEAEESKLQEEDEKKEDAHDEGGREQS